jgi:hypothetical protein
MHEYLNKSPCPESNRESNGTNGDDKTISWWSFTDPALLPADEPLESFVVVEERVELGEVGMVGLPRWCGSLLLGREMELWWRMSNVWFVCG